MTWARDAAESLEGPASLQSAHSPCHLELMSELESDMLSPSSLGRGATHSAGEKEAWEQQAEEEDTKSCDEGDGCCDEDDPLSGQREEEEGEPQPAEDETQDETQEVEEDTVASSSGKTKRKRGKSQGPKVDGSGPKASSKRASSVGSRLEELSKPKQAAEPPPEEASGPEKVVEKKKPKSYRPSLLLRLRPSNLEEAMDAFFASDFKEAPQFTYSYPEEQVTKAFKDNSEVCFDYLPEARRIMDKVRHSPGGVDAFMKTMYGEEKVSSEELRDLVADYLKEHNVEDKVEIRIVEGMLSAANVVKPSPDKKYIVNIAKGMISKPIIHSICDHEVGTHLLRMMNDEHQVWHGFRDRYKLANPWTTEEGFATLNTYLTLPSKLLYPQALRYWAVCRGAQTGFVELFTELLEHVNDAKRCWQICCRIKRGMIDTSLPGAFYMDQAYFKGAVEILKHLDEVDFGRLYGGQIALQDLDKVHFLLRKEVVRLPNFLNSEKKLQTYMVHCRRLIKENMIETSQDRVCKRVFVRAGMEFFKKEAKPALRAVSLTMGNSSMGGTHTSLPQGVLARLEDLAKPRQATAAWRSEGEAEDGEGVEPRQLDRARLTFLAAPRNAQSTVPGEEESPDALSSASRAPDSARLLLLAQPRKVDPPAVSASAKCRGSSAPIGDRHLSGSGESSVLRDAALRELSRPRIRAEVPAPPEPPPGSLRPLDLVRLSLLAAPKPKKVCEEEKATGVKCKGAPKARRKKRRSKLRLLAIVQAKKDSETEKDGEAQEEEDADEGEDAEEDDEEGRQEDGEEASAESSPLAEIPTSSVAACIGSRAARQISLGRLPSREAAREAVGSEVQASFSQSSSAAAYRRETSEEPELGPRRRSQRLTETRAHSLGVSVDASFRPSLPILRSPAGEESRSSLAAPWDRLAGVEGGGSTARGAAGVAGNAFVRAPPRLPAGLVRAASRAAATLKASRFGAEPEPMFKAVPIKMLQLDLGI